MIQPYHLPPLQPPTLHLSSSYILPPQPSMFLSIGSSPVLFPSQILLSLFFVLATSSPSILSLLVQPSFVIHHYTLVASSTGD